MMLQWQADANEFGLPEDVQKGLIFLIAFGGMHVNVPQDKNEWLRYTQKLSAKIRMESPHIPEGEGGNFYDAQIEPLLAEFMYMVDKDFSPRILEHGSEKLCWWERPAENKLPRCVNGELATLRDWEEVMISLCRQIGEYIDMDLEGAYLAGFLFYDSYLYYDSQSTMKISQAVTILPPQLLYFRTMLDFDPERLAQFGPISKIMDAFACGELEKTEKVYLAAYNYLQSMRQATGRNVWEYPIEVVADVAVQLKPFGDVDISRESWYSNTLENFRSNGWSTPAVCTTKEEVLRTVYAAIQRTWGFDCRNEDFNTMLPCSNILRKCAFVYSCAVLTVLNPNWNRLAPSTVEKSANEPEADESPEDDEPEFIEICKSAEQGDAEAQYKLGFYYYNGEGITKNDEQAAKWWRKAAEQGFLEAQSTLGVCYTNGIGVAKDDLEAVKWSRRAAEKGDKQAQYILGNCYTDGTGVEMNEAEAVKWYRKAAKQGQVDAQMNLGVIYSEGMGVAKDDLESVKWCRKAAAQEDPQAQRAMGNCCSKGIGVEKNEDEAAKWYHKAAEQGDAQAQRSLGNCYMEGIGVEKYEAGAVMWYRKAAEQGDAEAQLKLGFSYANGTGVAKDEFEAAKWFRNAAEQGDAIAQYNLGCCYYIGDGVAKDHKEAANWCHKSAIQGLAQAQYRLGYCYCQGEGVPQNFNEAVKWFKIAAEQGLGQAQHNLGICYNNGQGVVKNKIEAYKWYLLAASHGDETVTKNIEAIERLLPAIDLAEGQRLAEEWSVAHV